MRNTITAAILATLLGMPGYAAHVGFWNASFQLDNAQEVPKPNRGGGFGECVSSLQGTQLTLSCTHNLSDATAAHVHLGAPGVAGPVLFPLGKGVSPIQGKIDLSPEEVAQYAAGALYVNVHTTENPAGEIRGQIIPRLHREATSLLFSGDASQEVADVDSTATAQCRAIFSTLSGENQLRVICAHSVEMPTAAHVHMGAPGVNGPVLFPFEDPASPLDETFTLSAADVQDLMSGNLYVNIHTEANPSGEVRGNLVGCFENATTLCLQSDRFSVTVRGMTPSGEEFVGQAFERTNASGEMSFFSFDNLELLIKVLDGCDINDRYWVFYAATTNVEFDITVTDTRTGASVPYANPQGNPANAVTDTDAFATCP